MTAVARLGDIGMGICSGHPPPPRPFTSTIIMAGVTVMADGSLVANLNCLSNCTCGHMAVPTLVSALTLSEGSGVHRLGDTGLTAGGGTYVVTLAGVTVISG